MPKVIKSIQDSIHYYYYKDGIVLYKALIDEVIFPKVFLEQFDKAQDVDSVRLIVRRNLDNMAFNSYGFVASYGRVFRQVDDHYWVVENQVVRVKETPVSKALDLVTKNGKRVMFEGVVPTRMFRSDTRFNEKLIVYYSNKIIDSISVSSPDVKISSHVGRFAENLQEAKSL
ncbi:hypothetical protein [Chitinophaga sancti]|uniref:Uncharacterized protein n=1 Tax=Chitinophaga sancti TaxID=1004 RepID=A0ABZ0X8R6_9BACT|nr:hypothetical protein [Chitinophaga sancti]WQD61221.1 hypothetical protein U0033_25390 [Chitinophaga sancti]WQG86652.1 hypothetical protein SR876_17075 [Chitinophaga sancti]